MSLKIELSTMREELQELQKTNEMLRNSVKKQESMLAGYANRDISKG